MSNAQILFFYGNDEFAIRKQVEKFGALFSDPTTAGMNTARLDARTVSENELTNAIGAMPFLAAQRLVVLLPEIPGDVYPLSFACPHRGQMSRAVTQLYQWLNQQFSALQRL